MNRDSNICKDNRGILLTDTVDFDWLCSIEPRYERDFCKFTLNKETRQIVVGQALHASAKAFLGEDEALLYGGNIFFDDKHIEYESTLNVDKNLEVGEFGATPRIITDQGMIDEINSILRDWIKL